MTTQRSASTAFAMILLSLAVACEGGGGRSGVDSARPPVAAATDSMPGCIQVAGPRPDTSIRPGDTTQFRTWRLALLRGVEYRCVVHPSLAPFRVLVAHDTTAVRDSILVASTGQPAAAPQVIQLDTDFDWPSPWNDHALRMMDIDADGYADLVVGKSWGATGNTDFGLWFYDPATSRFVVDTAMRTSPLVDVVPGRPCFWSSWNWSAYDDQSAMQCRRDGRWMADSVLTHALDQKTRDVIETTEARRGDSLVVVRRRVARDTT